ncbi:dTDP-4-dehydrorhamnose reductase [Alkalihalobacillus sp. MEB130]|uniref:dTDP-4-dehydrorhamnose reductase n=1 Tax=Alkalihalobacillus sp. MEB130 TaxID=2976704 RepID=UPI0028DE8959|nr:dTDP-4-dehydrorhamnose reductase [Alkalihalobacillus sp. MEB130]MDT8860330.1 dTDP-4-dehydrorhamnose reductase [Alkalihalobacillus sp. MEB130]
MNILVTGANGQLGQELCEQLEAQGISYVGCSKRKLDVTSYEQVKKAFTNYNPDVIIHTAAYTNVDRAEQEEELAYEVNALGAKNVANVAKEIGAKLCYISTDYVFNGEGFVPYGETDEVSPLGVYGKTKFAGEQFVRENGDQYFIVRTSWVFGKHGQNFVKTMLRLAEEREELGVVHDQVGSPTYTHDLALFLIELIQTNHFGTYHASNNGSCSWYEFACTIFDSVHKNIKVNPLTTKEFPRPAPRPHYSVLGHEAIKDKGLRDFRHWKEALQDFLVEIGAK